MLNVTLLPILNDNYTYIIQCDDKVGLVDVGNAQPVIEYLKKNNLKPSFLFTTHHHWDHTNGIEEIKKMYNLHHIAPEKDKDRIPLINQHINENDIINFGSENIKVIETPGHTKNHIVFYCQNSKILFSGDTVFAMGCGRLFEGTAQDMFTSFKKIKSLPDETRIYCGHEYTLNNAEFSLSIMPNNQDIKQRWLEVKSLRDNKKPTIPTRLAMEKKTNPFMLAETVTDFQKYRDLKDSF